MILVIGFQIELRVIRLIIGGVWPDKLFLWKFLFFLFFVVFVCFRLHCLIKCDHIFQINFIHLGNLLERLHCQLIVFSASNIFVLNYFDPFDDPPDIQNPKIIPIYVLFNNFHYLFAFGFNLLFFFGIHVQTLFRTPKDRNGVNFIISELPIIYILNTVICAIRRYFIRFLIILRVLNHNSVRRIINRRNLMIKEFTKRNKWCKVKILSETSTRHMDEYPFIILFGYFVMLQNWVFGLYLSKKIPLFMKNF